MLTIQLSGNYVVRSYRFLNFSVIVKISDNIVNYLVLKKVSFNNKIFLKIICDQQLY